jgi:hypothetical protein
MKIFLSDKKFFLDRNLILKPQFHRKMKLEESEELLESSLSLVQSACSFLCNPLNIFVSLQPNQHACFP